jgi:hypothetical protein
MSSGLATRTVMMECHEDAASQLQAGPAPDFIFVPKNVTVLRLPFKRYTVQQPKSAGPNLFLPNGAWRKKNLKTLMSLFEKQSLENYRFGVENLTQGCPKYI